MALSRRDVRDCARSGSEIEYICSFWWWGCQFSKVSFQNGASLFDSQSAPAPFNITLQYHIIIIWCSLYFA